MLRFYWELGKDICERDDENKYGTAFYTTLSRDLKRKLPDAEGLSDRNLRYAKKFYMVYSSYLENLQQLVADSQHGEDEGENEYRKNLPQVVANFTDNLFMVPWGHHRTLIDKFSTEPEKAVFYAQQTVENGWSRDMLLNFISSDLYSRHSRI